jgi:hypothetical protein
MCTLLVTIQGWRLTRAFPIVLAIALSGCAGVPLPTTADLQTEQQQKTVPQRMLVVSARERVACTTCLPPTMLFVFSLRNPQSPTLVAASALKDSQARSFEAHRMRADAHGNVFLVGGFLTAGEQSVWPERPGILMLPARSVRSLDSFSTFDHGHPFDVAVDSRNRRIVATACRLGARMASYRDGQLVPLTETVVVPEPQCAFGRLQAVTFSPEADTLYLLNGDLYKANITGEGVLGTFEHLAQAPPSDGHTYIGPEVFHNSGQDRFIVNLVKVSTTFWSTQFRIIEPTANTNTVLYSTEPQWNAVALGALMPGGDRFVALERGWEPAWSFERTKARCVLHTFDLHAEPIRHLQSGTFECTRAIAVDPSGRFAYVGSQGQLGVFATEGSAFTRGEPIALLPFGDGRAYDVMSLAIADVP